MWLKLDPADRMPLSQRPVFEVDVWTTESVLVHVTVSPTLIVMGVGLKAEACIPTEAVAALAPTPPNASKPTTTAHARTVITPAARSRPLADPLVNDLFSGLILFLLYLDCHGLGSGLCRRAPSPDYCTVTTPFMEGWIEQW